MIIQVLRKQMLAPEEVARMSDHDVMEREVAFLMALGSETKCFSTAKQIAEALLAQFQKEQLATFEETTAEVGQFLHEVQVEYDTGVCLACGLVHDSPSQH